MLTLALYYTWINCTYSWHTGNKYFQRQMLGSGGSIDIGVADFCYQMDQQVQFWRVLLLCASIGKANTLQATLSGCSRFLSSSYVLCNRNRLISELHPMQATWIQSPDGELNAKSADPTLICLQAIVILLYLWKFSSLTVKRCFTTMWWITAVFYKGTHPNHKHLEYKAWHR